jgi:hypothetical protein
LWPQVKEVLLSQFPFAAFDVVVALFMFPEPVLWTFAIHFGHSAADFFDDVTISSKLTT